MSLHGGRKNKLGTLAIWTGRQIGLSKVDHGLTHNVGLEWGFDSRIKAFKVEERGGNA